MATGAYNAKINVRMGHNFLFALWFFWPAGIATLVPVFVSNIPVLRNIDGRMDGGRHFHGKRIFGDNKTWRGFTAGVLGGCLIALIQPIFYSHSALIQSFPLIHYTLGASLLLGFLLSLGAMLGDAGGSFLKRQVSIPSGRSWFPVDQIDFIIGGLLLSALVVRLTTAQYGIVLSVWVMIHLITNAIGYALHVKDSIL